MAIGSLFTARYRRDAAGRQASGWVPVFQVRGLRAPAIRVLVFQSLVFRVRGLRTGRGTLVRHAHLLVVLRAVPP